MNRRYSHQKNRKAATTRATRKEKNSQPDRNTPTPPCPAAASCGSASHVNVVWPLASNTSNSTPAKGNSTESEQARMRTLNRHLPFTKWRMAENVTPPKARYKMKRKLVVSTDQLPKLSMVSSQNSLALANYLGAAASAVCAASFSFTKPCFT